MTVSNTAPRTAAEINTRREAIGAELAKGRFVPVANARALEAEDAALKLEYIAAIEREGEAALVARRVEVARKAQAQRERAARIDKAVADAMR